MTTKAEVLSAIESISKAVQATALVAANLRDAPPLEAVPDVSFQQATDGSLFISSKTVTDAKWTYVSNDGKNYPWYGNATQITLPAVVKPAYNSPSDFIKVLYGDGYSKGIDGPKVAPPVVVPATPIPPVGNPRAFLRGMTVNVNLERMRPTYMKYQGASLTKPAYYQYLAARGVTGVRYFIPYRADRDMGLGTGVPDVSAWDGILDAAQSAIMAGLRAFVGFTDVVGEGVIKFDDWNKHADNVAKRISERGFEPGKLVPEIANELAGYDNPFWNKMRTSVHDTIRKRLPYHTIGHGACGWNGIDGWNESWAMPSDNNILGIVHDYASRDSATWQDVYTKLTKFGKARGISMISGEQGDYVNKSDPANMPSWIDNYRNMAVGAGLLIPNLWTVTGDPNGNAFRLNRSGVDPTLTPQIETVIADMNTIIRGTPGWVS